MDSQPPCNQYCYKMTAAKVSVSPEQVEEFFSFICEFTEKKIKEGSMEVIMLPNFGKFRPKIKQVQFVADRLVHPKLPHQRKQKDEATKD
jgi:hypothetical protein